jgi:hypothetical protein
VEIRGRSVKKILEFWLPNLFGKKNNHRPNFKCHWIDDTVGTGTQQKMNNSTAASVPDTVILERRKI